MIILHVANLTENRASGVNVVVPMHIKAQSQIADVALVNYSNIRVDGVKQFDYSGCKGFPSYLPKPFDKPDIVVFHEANNIKNIKVYGNLLKKDIPYIIIPHGELSKEALKKKWLKKKIAYLLFFNRFIKKAKAVQCLTKREADASEIAKIKFIVPNGMDLHERIVIDTKKTGMNLLYIGRLDWVHKGIDLLISAMGSVKDFLREKGVVLNIYGPCNAQQAEKINEMIKESGTEDFVFLHEGVFGDEKVKVYKENDVFIQTSRFEGLPMGILEALSYGMPVIATQGTGMGEEIKRSDCGYFAGDNEKTIAEAIKQAYLTKNTWETKGKNAQELIKENYAWDKIATKSIDEYKQLIER